MDRCPQCSYSLHGLPDVHRCPECGFEYERDATVFRADRRMWWFLVIFGGLGLLGGIVETIWRGRFSFMTCHGVFLLGGIWRMRRMRAFVVISRTRVRVFHGDRREETYPTANIGSARWNFVNGDIVIDTPDGSRLATIPQKLLYSNKRAKAAAREITNYADAARGLRTTHPEDRVWDA